jgi:hypothetical protein
VTSLDREDENLISVVGDEQAEWTVDTVVIGGATVDIAGRMFVDFIELTIIPTQSRVEIEAES